MKILIAGFSKLKYMPYIQLYLSEFDNHQNEIDVLYWNRDNKEDIDLPYNVTLLEFNHYLEDEVPKHKKIMSFAKYRKYFKKIISTFNYDLIIMLTTIPAILNYSILSKKFKNKYIFDYRDVTFEKFTLYKYFLNKVIGDSIITLISSDAFRKHFKNDSRIHTTHNLSIEELNNRGIRSNFSRDNKTIRIRYWGLIRHENINIEIISKISKDPRFELHYHGREQDTAIKLKRYCELNNINNVFFHGEYKPNERYRFAKETELIHNIFENDNTMQPAMSNKYYDGIVYQIPQLCNLGSYMGERVTNNDVGYEIDPYKENFLDEIYNYYYSLSWEKFQINCEADLSQIISELNLSIEAIKAIKAIEK